MDNAAAVKLIETLTGKKIPKWQKDFLIKITGVYTKNGGKVHIIPPTKLKIGTKSSENRI